MLTVFIFILFAFLLFRLVSGIVQRFLDSNARGRSFRKLIEQGRIDSGIYGEVKWAGKGTPRTKISREQRRIVRDAQLKMREDFLDDHTPGLYQYIIIFLIASVLGLVIETVYIYIVFGILESRVGLVWGPFSSLYGVGAVLLTAILWPLRKQSTFKLFFLSAGIGGALEQFAGWAMENFAHMQSWTYLGLPDHITQWVAWRFLFMWGLLGVIWCRVIMPEMLFRIGEPTNRRQAILVSCIGLFLVLDCVMTIAVFYRAGQRFEGVPPQNAFEQYVDMHYDDKFMAKKFQNIKIGKDIQPANM